MTAPSMRDEAPSLPWKIHIGRLGGPAIITRDLWATDRDAAWQLAEEALSFSAAMADWAVLDVEPMF